MWVGLSSSESVRVGRGTRAHGTPRVRGGIAAPLSCRGGVKRGHPAVVSVEVSSLDCNSREPERRASAERAALG